MGRAEKLAGALRAKGLNVYTGRLWDGAHDPGRVEPFWYLHPRANGGVGAYYQRDGGVYDMGWLDPELFEDVMLPAVEALPEQPTREAVWEALKSAPEWGGRR